MAATSFEDLEFELDLFNIQANGDEEFQDQVLELCASEGLSADKFSNSFMAFSLKLTGDTKVLNSETLAKFAKQLQKKEQKTPTTRKVEPKFISPQVALDRDDIGDLLDAYGTPGQAVREDVLRTPEVVRRKTQQATLADSPGLSRLSQSPAGARYASRTNAGEVVHHHGREGATVQQRGREPAVKVLSGAREVLYMFDKLGERAQILNDALEELSGGLQAEHGGEVGQLGLPSHDAVRVCGRVCCDATGRLNTQSVVLEGSRETSGGRAVPLALESPFSLFPGQVVMVEGSNPNGARLSVSRVFPGVMPPPPPSSPHPAPNGLSLLVAAGPFTTSDSLGYQPLADLLARLKQTRPDLAVLMGPFVDIKHPAIEGNTVTQSYDELFSACVEEIATAAETTSTHVLLLPSSRDVFHAPVYPQPPLALPAPLKNSPYLHVLPDPCTVEVDGVVLGITSTDVIMHLSAEEISKGMTQDRISRLVGHLLTQRSFYPLSPPHDDVPLDVGLQEQHGLMTSAPHLLLTPSDLRHFVKVVEGVAACNPGRLTKGGGAGTYLELQVAPPLGHTGGLADRVSADIRRI